MMLLAVQVYIFVILHVYQFKNKIRVLLDPSVSKVGQNIKSYWTLHLGMNVMPRLTRPSGLGSPDCAVLVKISSVQREEGLEQVVLRIVISTISYVNTSNITNQSSSPTSISKICITNDGFLMMSVQRGDKLTSKTHPRFFLPRHIGTLDSCTFEECECVLIMCSHHTRHQS